ncbi:mannose-6-phosphate isomerase, class I [Saccharomonospora azurea]|uniref:mannose-6-phosphate isomerase n=1 Tax=Saccharomonospora azurea NA-128 TaxID=882081 RepID=H8GCD1_9PSEU|nr:mannose-6-phosphate isomerase, class I [Saccharomonospora azurea]EHK87780.1 mannose-6-phosphate isomerase [Saccharomonospora azurea SZMC 14600]EHY88765.1 mannose-6-phosphate isomerase, class I [Saccharomonospora azurea NA-128]
MTVELLRNAVRPYAWGSRTTIPELLGRPVPAPHPEAELWMGAHPGDPSHVVSPDGTERSLLELVESDPVGQLGEVCADRWGGRLPFLLKILAVEEPLSMQAHPSAEQAAEGWAREEAAGIPRDAPNRNYPDPTAKPELVCALSEFHALAGFRDPRRTVRLLRAIDTPGLTRYTELLAAQPDADGLRALFTSLITMPQPTLDQLLPEVLDACVRHIKERGEFDVECRTVLELGEAHPHDAGVLAALLLNRLTLRAGEALYLAAGNLHLYLHGTAVEILANSDNILRGGLTPKHVDVPELLRVLDFSSGDMPVMGGERGLDEHVAVYRTDAPEFELSRLEWPDGDTGEVTLGGAVPQILLCTEGELLLVSEDGTKVELRRGESVWLPACDPEVRIRPTVGGPARVFRATAGTCV